jgi:hypothetical protein
LTVTEKDLKQIAPVMPDSDLFLFKYQPLTFFKTLNYGQIKN